MEEINSIKGILKSASNIVKNHEKIERDTGYKFNIFTLTKTERFEVNTHSAMIAELLNPNGSHGQGSIFLQKFIDCIEEHLESSKISKNAIDCDHVTVLKEKSYNLGQDRVDILLEFNSCILLIENKIDAADGKKQLQRYFEVGKKANKKCCLLYLTKYGGDASESSHVGVPYEKISYREHIVDWLEGCIKEAALVPIVREAILQYLNLVKKITGISMTSEFKEEMVALLLEGSNFQHAQKIAASMDDAKSKALYDFFEEIRSKIPTKNPDYKVIDNIDADRLYNESKCSNWIKLGKKSKKRAISIGIFFDVNLPGFLFHIEVKVDPIVKTKTTRV